MYYLTLYMSNLRNGFFSLYGYTAIWTLVAFSVS
jgi:hypothetical protein